MNADTVAESKSGTEIKDAVTDDCLATDNEISRAREMYQTDDIQIDDGAQASRGDEWVWVQAWVCIPIDASIVA